MNNTHVMTDGSVI
jgi:mannosyl-oligosaccharide alpha-1,3-glucosidase